MKCTTAFCFSYTPFHSYFLEQMDFTQYNKVYVVNFSSRVLNLRDRERAVYLINSRFFLFRLWQFFWFLIRSPCFLRIQKELYLAHPHHEVANAFFFSKHTCARHLIQDGIANYYDAELTADFEKKIIKRLFWLRLFGYRFYQKPHDFFGSDFLDRVFVFFPDKLTRNLYSKGVAVVVRAELQPKNEAVVLFLDQPICGLFSNAEQERLRYSLKTDLLGFSQILYKSHHDGGSELITALVGRFVVRRQWHFLTAEELFLAEAPAVVMSYISSALINIKALSPAVTTVAYIPLEKKLRRNGEWILMRDFFALFGVEVRSV